MVEVIHGGAGVESVSTLGLAMADALAETPEE
jgi:hypothetical protein